MAIAWHKCHEISIHALRRRRRREQDKLLRMPFISIHALREEATCPWRPAHAACCISIHALREEGDEMRKDYTDELFNFYPRPPRGGDR